MGCGFIYQITCCLCEFSSRKRFYLSHWMRPIYRDNRTLILKLRSVKRPIFSVVFGEVSWDGPSTDGLPPREWYGAQCAPSHGYQHERIQAVYVTEQRANSPDYCKIMNAIIWCMICHLPKDVSDKWTLESILLLRIAHHGIWDLGYRRAKWQHTSRNC